MKDHMRGWQRRYVCEPYLNSLGLHIYLCEAHQTNWQSFFLVFFMHNSRPDLTSNWHPQVKLSGREGLPPAHQWV